MRFIRVLVVLLIGLGAGVWWAATRNRPPSPRQVSSEKPAPKKPFKQLEDGSQVQSGTELLARSIRAAISRGGAIPRDTRLIRLELSDDGRCTVELSSEFLAVNSGGSTGESQAQNALRHALAAFPRVKTLTVLVDGAVFEGSHSGEWQDIPVAGAEPPPTGDP